MDVLLVTAVVGGGVGRHVQHLAHGLSSRGHRVVVACPAAVAEQFGLADHGATVVPIEIGSGRLPIPSGQDLRLLRRLMRRADVTHAHGVRAGALAAVAGWGSASVGPLAVTSHNAPPPGPSGAVYRLLERVTCSGADVVLGVSPDLVDRARSARAREVGLAVVPAGDTPVLTEEVRQAARRSLRAELGLPPEDGPPVIFSAGRLGRQKRTDLLLDAYHRLVRRRAVTAARDPEHPEHPDHPVLVVAGEGPERQQLEDQAAGGPGDVRLLGHRPDVPALLAGADLAVSAAAWEGQPLFVQEALAAGVPVVATDVGGTGVVVGGAGILVPDADDEAAVAERLATALARVLDDPQHAADLRARSLARAAELPTLDDAVQAALAVYEHVIARP